MSESEEEGIVPMAELYGTSESFYEELLKVSSCAYSRLDDDRWRQRVRFLALTRHVSKTSHGNNEAEEREAQSQCCCVKAGYQPFSVQKFTGEGSSLPVLELTDPGRFATCSHYVAISYCWASSLENNESFKDLPMTKYNIITSKGERQNIAPSKVLRRAIAYAAHRALPFIWIDQECIMQDDQDEKEEMISYMDRIYHQARYVVALLEAPVLPEHLAMYNGIGMYDQELVKSGNWYRAKLKLRHDSWKLAVHIAKDKWFSRAWTFQESIVAAWAIDMLLPLNPSLKDHLKSSFTCLERDLLINQKSLLALDAVYKIRHRPFTEGCQEYKKAEMKPATDFKFHGISSFFVYKTLQGRNLLIPFDTVSIIANLCSYRIRIDVRKAKALGLDIWVCLFGQALLNGDMSLILAYAKGHRSPNGFFTSHNGFSCDPLPSFSLKVIGYGSGEKVRSRVQPIILKPEGLYIPGILWKPCKGIDFTALKKIHVSTLEAIDQRGPWQEACVLRFLKDITLRGRQRTATLLFRILTAQWDMWDFDGKSMYVEMLHNAAKVLKTLDIPSDHSGTAERYFSIPFDPSVSNAIINGGYLSIWKPANLTDSRFQETYLYAAGKSRTCHLFTPRRELISEEEYESGRIEDEVPTAGHTLMWEVDPAKNGTSKELIARSFLMKIWRDYSGSDENLPYRIISDNWSIFNEVEGEKYLLCRPSSPPCSSFSTLLKQQAVDW